MPLGPTSLPQFPTMIAAAQSNGPTAFLTINNMFPAPLSNQSNALIPLTPNLPPPANQTLNSGSFILPSTAFPTNANLAGATPFSSPPQAPILPFFVPVSTNFVGSTPAPISLSTNFCAPLPHLLHSTLGSHLPTFSSAASSTLSTTSVPDPLLHSSDPLPLPPMSSNLLTSQPLVLPTLPVTFNTPTSFNPTGIVPLSLNVTQSPSSSVMSDVITVVSSTTNYPSCNSMLTTTLFPLTNSAILPSATASTSFPSTTDTQVYNTATSEPVTLTTSVKSERAHQVVTTFKNNNSVRYFQALEAVDFHRDAILDAIDKLRERKARPDFERISCLLKRYQNINPEQTQLCLGRLADAGAVVCVDYKGNLSYRNPSKWRKTAAVSGSGITNLPSVSQRLVESVKRLMDGSISALVPAPQPGPNGGYSLFQIERALMAISQSSHNGTNMKNSTELSGATLRVCLDREATHGKLAKTADGRFLLDESGERKRSSSNAFHLPHKKLLPPYNTSCGFYTTNNVKVSRLPTLTAAIAPAESASGTRLHPLAARHVPNGAISIAPGISGKPVPLSSLPNPAVRPLNSGRRGRPPGSKTKKNPIPEVPLEKKIKTEGYHLDTSLNVDPIGSSDQNPNFNRTSYDSDTSLTSNLLLSRTKDVSFGPATQDVQTTTPSSGVSSSTSSSSLNGQIPQASISITQGLMSEHPLMSSLPQSFPTTQCVSFSSPTGSSSTLSTVTCTPNQGPISQQNMAVTVTDVNDLGSTIPDNNISTMDKMNDKDGVCCRCGGQPTLEEAFLLCKDCGLIAHPTCLDYWPELTERARQSPWQCTDCKTCSVCDNKDTCNLVICDACDKGFHIECHQPKLQESIDLSLPWVCRSCQNEGYRVAIGTLPSNSLMNKQMNFDVGSSQTLIKTEENEADVNENKDIIHNSDTIKQESANYSLDDELTETESKSDPSSTVYVSNNFKSKSSIDDDANNDVGGLIDDHCSSGVRTLNNNINNNGNDSGKMKISNQLTSETHPMEIGSTVDGRNSLPELLQSVTNCDSSTVGQYKSVNDCISGCYHKAHQSPSYKSLTEGAIGGDNNTNHYRNLTDVSMWSVDHVRHWLLDEGFPREAEAFFQQEIDGTCLLLMKRMDVLTELGIKLGPAVKIYERIKRLQSQQQCHSPAS